MSEEPMMLPMEWGRLYAADEPSSHGIESTWNADGQMDAPLSRPKVLVVDDQRLIADTLAEILVNAGFEAVAAYDGWEALEVASRFRPHWLLSDVLMPRMNGVELAIAIQQRHPKATILLFSGQAGISGILEEGHRKGYEFELIAKPIHPQKLIDRLKEQ